VRTIFAVAALASPAWTTSVQPLGRAAWRGYDLSGRVRLSSDVSEIKLVFSIPPHRPTPNFPPSWNAAPTDQLPVVRYDRKAEERSLDLLRWGLIPYWAKDLNVAFANINAKAERVETRPAFRDAFQRRRCLVPVDNFYEWKKTGTGKQPYAIALADRSLMALAGLWENWCSPAGEWVRSFAIITTTPNELCALKIAPVRVRAHASLLRPIMAHLSYLSFFNNINDIVWPY
jgi:putative SOS response-associated peptidase YedK